MSSTLKTTFCGVCFKNPIVVASTDIGRTAEGFERFAKTGVGGIITKSVTDAAPLQNKGITMFDVRNMDETPVGSGTGVPDDYYFFSRGGAMISMDAYEATALQILSIARQYEVIPIASICASKLENWVTYARRFEEMGYPMLELNLGNPHGEAAKDKLGFKISQETQLCVEIASTVTHAVKIPVVVKLTPQVADLSALTQALEASGVPGEFAPLLAGSGDEDTDHRVETFCGVYQASLAADVKRRLPETPLVVTSPPPQRPRRGVHRITQ